MRSEELTKSLRDAASATVSKAVHLKGLKKEAEEVIMLLNLLCVSFFYDSVLNSHVR